ncbi:MAG: hypothetical protein M3Y82_02245 [Verrucomicrobiota bacterium]|nr:hypothetical protein [Verrucomicrobiota bacterium]
MKKFFIVLGLIFFTVIVIGAIGIGFIAYRGNALDKESKAYADSAIPTIVTGWNENELLARASSEFKQAVTTDQLDRLFRWVSGLGQLQKCDPAQGHALMSATTQAGKMISAKYTARATFQKGEATIKLGLIKHGNQWQILSFYVASPALVPP